MRATLWQWLSDLPNRTELTGAEMGTQVGAPGVVIDIEDARRCAGQCQHRRGQGALQREHVDLVGDRCEAGPQGVQLRGHRCAGQRPGLGPPQGLTCSIDPTPSSNARTV